MKVKLSSMGANLLLKTVYNELGKKDNCVAFFRIEFDQFNNTGAQMLDSL